MSRLTPPVSKLNHAVRSMSSTVAKANIVDSSRHVSIYLPRKLSDLREECGKREIGVHGTKLDVSIALCFLFLILSMDFIDGFGGDVLPLVRGLLNSV